MGFGSLRVINEDWIQPGKGFQMHPHRDMEILTYVLEGALAHRDSMGNGSVIGAGEFQRMSAGSGVRHSEFNGSDRQEVHLLQIWIRPAEKGMEPSYEQMAFEPPSDRTASELIASPDGREGALTIHQSVCVYRVTVNREETFRQAAASGEKLFVYAVRGRGCVQGQGFETGDGAGLEDEPELVLSGTGLEVLLFIMDESPEAGL